MKFVYSPEEGQTIIKHEIEMFEKYSEILKSCAVLSKNTIVLLKQDMDGIFLPYQEFSFA